MILTHKQKEELCDIYREGGLIRDEIQRIIDAYEKMRSDSDEWISVKERLPTEEDAYENMVIWWHHNSCVGVNMSWDGPTKNFSHYTHWKRIIPPVITPPTLEEVERPKFEKWGSRHGYHLIRRGEEYTGCIANALWNGWISRAKSEQSAKA